MNQISVAIITYNEEQNIGRCIDSVIDIADEILVVDSFSTDATKDICIQKGVRFIENKFKGYIEQKNFAMESTTYNHVLSLDADEALSERSQEVVKELKHSNIPDACSFNRLTNYCRKWIKYCGWYPDKKVRLINKKKARWGGENPHDRIVVDSSVDVKDLRTDILHYAIPSIESHVERANAFSSIAADQFVGKGKRIYFVVHILMNPIFTFIKKYFFQRGFLDGFYGFMICTLSAYSNFLKYSKIWHLKNENPHIKD